VMGLFGITDFLIRQLRLRVIAPVFLFRPGTANGIGAKLRPKNVIARIVHAFFAAA
jgi:hypothetical protein